MPIRTVVVTGANAGVGRATARALAAGGCRIALIARGEDGLDAEAEEMRAAGAQPLTLGLDSGASMGWVRARPRR